MKHQVIALICLVVTAFAAEMAAAEETCVVYVRGIVGVVEVFAADDTDWDDAELDQCLRMGDKIRTGQDGHVNLDFTSRADVSVNALSQFEIGSSNAGGEIDQFVLSSGAAWLKIEKSGTARSSFSVRTPTAVAGVRGTEFDVEVAESGDSDINVMDGEVDVSNEYGASIAKKGEGLRVRKGKGPDRPAKFNIEERKKRIALWKDKIKKGKDLRTRRQRLHENRKNLKGKILEKKKEAKQKFKEGKMKKKK